MNIQGWVRHLFGPGKPVTTSQQDAEFVDLTPVDDADDDGSYSKALDFAFSNDRIKNIALTGPYGSGKSSIIRTFEKNNPHKYRFLNISLASFKEDGIADPDDESKSRPSDDESRSRLIERSILQQMLYGADANKLPYSRFKRILTPERPLLKSFCLVCWATALYGLYQYRIEVLDIVLNSDSYFWRVSTGLFAFVFVLAIPSILISHIYKASFGLSLKKFSLTNAEIETGIQTEDSILNRHLDEIIYFFQETDYSVIVIEDLDRFGDPEIFIKLREINKLINDNEKTSGNIKFLYALKDDMFVHNNRTKFFDFIIPVVPVINSFNSLDKMQERLNRLPFKILINPQFLREVSLYIDDLRLIHNIFNEFLIYYSRLKSESLDATKLLALMIYKNVYPNDFENLHHGKGAFFNVCHKKLEYIQNTKVELNERLEKLRLSLDSAENEKARSVSELIKAYIGHLVFHTNQPVDGFAHGNNGNQYQAFNQLTGYEQFEPLTSEKNIQLAVRQGGRSHHRIPINKSFQQIEREINPGETFLDRKENIENKSAIERKGL